MQHPQLKWISLGTARLKLYSPFFHIFYAKCQTLIESMFSEEELKYGEKKNKTVFYIFFSEEQCATRLTQNNVYYLYVMQNC